MSDMKRIYCKNHDKPILVDDCDYEFLSKVNWFFMKKHGGKGGYVVSTKRTNGYRHSMHRVIMGLQKMNGVQVDHINGDTLDNRRQNLRLCSAAENSRNTRKRSVPSKSKYKGVRRNKHGWRAAVNAGKRYLSRVMPDEITAAAAYNVMARKLHGDFACLNQVEKKYEEIALEILEKPKAMNATSNYRGVSRNPSVPTRPWLASITHGGRQITIGRFATPEEAAMAYNTKASELKGDKARLNEIH